MNRNCGKRGETSWEIKRKRGTLKRGTSKRGNEMSKGRRVIQEGEMGGRKDGSRKEKEEEEGEGREEEERGGGEGGGGVKVERRRGENAPDGK